MAFRSPLFGFVRRCLDAARYSLATGIPPDEVLEVVRERATATRREFLRTTGLAAAGVALGCAIRPKGPWQAPSEEVVVVGAGIAGLTAAYRLHQEGVRVRLLEAQNRVGGRMYSLRGFFPEGQVCELGGELIDTGHTAIRSLAAELGVALDDLATDDPALAREIWHFGGRIRSEAEVVRAFLPVARRIEADLAILTGDITYRTPNGAEALDRTPLSRWLDGIDGIEPWFRDLLDLAYTTEYGLETSRQSALNLLLLIDPEPDPFRIFGESDERFRAHLGNDAITAELARRLDGVIETGTRLEAVQELPDGSFRLALRRGEGRTQIRADHLVLTLPFTLLRQVDLQVDLPPVKRRAIHELGYGTNAKLMVGFGERVWRTRHGSNGSVFSDLGFQTTWETSRLQPGRHGILTNFTGGEHGLELGRGTAAEHADRMVAQLEGIFPGATEAHAGMKSVRFHWPSAPFVLGSYACYLPGQWTGIAGAEGERVRRLHFAGEHCSREGQGFMEGGCESGEGVAREILRDLGRTGVARAA